MFDDKKKGLEKIIDLDTQKKFKVTATRNKSLGRWAGEQLGLEKSKIDGYVDEVIMADFEKPGFEDVIKKILNDFKKAGISISYNEIKETLLKYEKEAINKISEFRMGKKCRIWNKNAYRKYSSFWPNNTS